MIQDYLPLFVSGKSPQELYDKIREIQSKLYGTIKIISMYYDGRSHICWYFAPRNTGGSVF